MAGGVWAPPQLLVWPQDEPVAVVCWGHNRRYPGGPYIRSNFEFTDPGDLDRYLIDMHMPQDRV